MSEKKHVVFTYGTLRNNVEATHRITGYQMCAYQGRDFEFPYLVPKGGEEVYGNIIEVDDVTLAEMDKYENIRSGLFVREVCEVFSLTGDEDEQNAWVYVAGPALLPEVVESGDWLKR